MRFTDRHDAGQRLAAKLLKYKNDPHAIVLGLPRGGVITAYETAKILKLPLDIIVTRKIGAPGNPELAIGAVDDLGYALFNEEIISGLSVPQTYLEQAQIKEQTEAQNRLSRFRKKRPPLNLKGKTAILVDDGLATGATMRAAIHSARARHAQKIVVAVPVAASDSIEKIKKEVDEIVCVHIPFYFGAVGAFYEVFDQIEDDEVAHVLQKSPKQDK